MIVNNLDDLIIHKTWYKKGKRHGYEAYKNNHPVATSKQVVNEFDIGYLGVGKDFPKQLSALQFKKNEIWINHKKKRV